MKIGLTTRTFYPESGGMQTHVEKLAKELESREHRVVVATRSVTHTPSFQDFFYFSESISQTTIHDIDVHLLRHNKTLNAFMWVISKCIGRRYLKVIGIWLFQLVFTRQLVRAFENVDVVQHIGQGHELIGFAAAKAAKKLDVPFLIQPLSHPGQWGDSPFDLLLYKKANLLLVNTSYERDKLQELGLNNPFSIVGCGVSEKLEGNADRFRKKYAVNNRIILFLGRKTSDKGYILLRETFSLIEGKVPNVTLVCMGPGKTFEEFKDPKNTETPANVIEVGFAPVQDKHDALAACDLLCVPSEGESFGLVYMEAGLHRKPSVARRLPVLEELLERKEAILLDGTAYGEGNKVNLTHIELGNAVLKLLENPKLSKKIGQNAYQVASDFVWSKVTSNFEEAYAKAISHYAKGTT
ncbi:MAG: glycosyltransferase family 4 protein [Cyanobacteria bacterium J06560_6]